MAGKQRPTNFWNTIAFITLTVQTAATVLMMRYSRLQSSSDPNIPQFATTSAVAMAEFGKMWVGLIILSYDILITKSSHDPFTTVSNQLFGDFTTLFKMAVPACTYSVQNNLLLIALHHLDSSLYQITYQLKIFTAALFAIALLGKPFSARQFIDASTIKQSSNDGAEDRNQAMGLICVLLATCTSGFAGNFP